MRAAAVANGRRGPPGILPVETARELSGAGQEELDEFIRRGMACNVAAALDVEDLSIACDWVGAELARSVA